MNDLDKFFHYLKVQIGKPYSLGSFGPDQFDCSGLIYSALKQITLDKIPRVSTDQYLLGKAVNIADIQKGDLVFFDTGWSDRKPNHIGFCTSSFNMINANSYNKAVMEESFKNTYWKEKIFGVRRIFDQNGKLCLSELDIIPAVQHFKDVPPAHQFFKHIEELYEKGIINGYQNDLFKPDVDINRVEALKIILIAMMVDVPEKFEPLTFSDTKNGAWYEKFIAAGLHSGIINGYPDGTFMPNNKINRAEMCKTIFKSGKVEPEKPHASMFEDVPLSTWHANYVLKAVEWEMFSPLSNNKFGPDNFVTRGEMCKAIVNFLKKEAFI